MTAAAQAPVAGSALRVQGRPRTRRWHRARAPRVVAVTSLPARSGVSEPVLVQTFAGPGYGLAVTLY